MHICQNHWHELKNAVRKRGLWPLVTSAGYLATDMPEEILALNAAQFVFDPLMVASLMISDQARSAFGGCVTAGINCPLCAVDQNLGDGRAADWIDTDTDLILQVCLDRHLVEIEDL